MQQKLTVDLGPLLAILRAHCQATGERPSDVVRRALARELSQPVPVLRGQVANLWQVQGIQHPRKKPSPRRQRSRG